MIFDEKTLSEEYVYKGKILNLRRDKVELPSGNEAYREIVEHSGGSCVVCEKDGKILFVKQFRYPYKRELLELPAGKRNRGEDPLVTATRELEEEAGIKAGKMQLLFKVFPSPGYTEEVIYIYRASDLTFTKAHLDEDEFLSVVWIETEKLKEMIDNGEIEDAKTLIALLRVLK